MNEKYLTFEQNICAARIFLNTFGLTLENTSKVIESSIIKIFDKAMNEVGELHFNNGKVIMTAHYNNSVLEASYDIAKVSSFVDIECSNALFGQWSSKIAFQFQNGNNLKLAGEFVLGNTIDSEFGISCFCRPLIKCEIPEKGSITLRMLREGKMFGLEVISGDTYEEIEIMPSDSLNGFIRHDIKIGQYDEEKYTYPYRRYAGIFNGAERGENKDKLHIFLEEEEYDNRLAFYNEFLPKVGTEYSSESFIQKGLLMQKLDSTMQERINELREILIIADVSLLDNLISVCYDIYSDDVLYALLGLKREQMNYQNGADTLVNSYYGIGKNSCFFPLELEKRLLKN